MKKQKAEDPGTGESLLRSKLDTEVSSNVGEVLGSGNTDEIKNSGTTGGFGDKLKTQEPAPAQSMEEEL